MENSDCLFCKIVSGEIPSEKVYEDELLVAFRDIHPVAPTHILIVPKKHIADNNDFEEEDTPIAGRMLFAAKEIASQEGIADSGYRLVMNTGKDGRQEIQHLHLHLLGGRLMQQLMG